MKKNAILIALEIIGIVFVSGCVSINLGPQNGMTSSQTTAVQNSGSSISTTQTINQATWTTVVDSSYLLTGKCGLNEVIIPVTPDSAYRLTVKGNSRLAIEIFQSISTHCDSQGNHIGYSMGDSTMIARAVTDYNGIFKTNTGQTNLRIEWLYLANAANEPNIVGSSQNINVKLERYNGDISIFPKTTDVDAGVARSYN